MKRYRIIGKSDQMRSVFLKNLETGKFQQHKIVRGKQIDVTEDELTFHVERQKGLKILDVIEIEDVVKESSKKAAPKSPPKRRRARSRRKREIIVETDES